MPYRIDEVKCDACDRVVPRKDLYSVTVFSFLGKRELAVLICPYCVERIPGSSRMKDLTAHMNRISRDKRIAEMREKILEGV